MTKSPDFGVPLLAQAQENPDITHNEAIMLFQALSNGVIDMATSVPPGSPTEGDSYVIAAAPSGAWTGFANHIAIYWGGAWRFVPGRDDTGAIISMGARQEGLRVYDRATDASYVWTGSAWSASAVGPFVLKAGDTMTGPLTFTGTGGGAGDVTIVFTPNGSIWAMETYREGTYGAFQRYVLNHTGVLSGSNIANTQGHAGSDTFGAPIAFAGFNFRAEDEIGGGNGGLSLNTLVAGVFSQRAILKQGFSIGTSVDPGLGGLHVTNQILMNSLQLVTPNRQVVKRVVDVAGLAGLTETLGATAHVTDANATTLGTVVAAGGANFVPVTYDGTNWRIG